MNLPRFDRFSQPEYLQQIGRERVTKLLLPFAQELLGLGIALPAAALPDDLFFQVLATLPRQARAVSEKLQDAMVEIEFIDDVLPDEVFPDERRPLVVTELRLRLRSRGRPILLGTSGQSVSLDCEVIGGVELGGGRLPEDDGRDSMGADMARQLFALVEKMESDRNLKRPSVMEVFRLYCIKGKTTDQIVDICKTSKGTVMNRLKVIRSVTGKNPKDLQAFSPYLQRIEETIADSRAEYIHRKGLVHDIEVEEEGAD